MPETATDDEVARKIIAILAEQAVLDPSEVRPDASPEELGVDSLGLVEAVFAIEEAFDITVPFNANEPTSGEFDISSVARIIEAVKTLISRRDAGA